MKRRELYWEGALVNPSDAVLLEAFGRGDTAAFEALFARHYNQVYRVLYGLLGSREEAEDVAQETFLVLLHQPPHLAETGGLIAWLCRVALNRGYNALRGAQRERLRIERVGGAPAIADPQAELLRAEERREVRDAIGRLPERQGQLLLLRHAGLSYAEIAASLNIASGSVGTLLARAERAFIAAYGPTTEFAPEHSLDTRAP